MEAYVVKRAQEAAWAVAFAVVTYALFQVHDAESFDDPVAIGSAIAVGAFRVAVATVINFFSLQRPG